MTNMNVITLACQKGGVGKTTVAVNLASSFVEAGNSVAVLDMDTQGSAYLWGKKRRAKELKKPAVFSVMAIELEDRIKELKAANCNVIIIDTRGAGDSDAAKAVKVSNVVLVPVQPSGTDLRALGLTLDMTDYARKPAYVFLNRCKKVSERYSAQAEETIRRANGNVANVRICDRMSFEYSMDAGLSVLEYRDAHHKRLDLDAVAEVQSLYSFTVGKLV